MNATSHVIDLCDESTKKRKTLGLMHDSVETSLCNCCGTSFDTMKCDTCRIISADGDEDEFDGAFHAAIDKLDLIGDDNNFDSANIVDVLLMDDLQGPAAKRARVDNAELQSLEEQATLLQERHSKEEASMLNSSTARAWKLGEEILQLQHNLQSHGLKPIGGDSFVRLTKRFIAQQEQFALQGRDAIVSIGYHYTKNSNLESIRQDGLMSQTERHFKRTGWFGDGIYTSHEPLSFSMYGPVGLIVAILKGNTARVDRKELDRVDSLDTGVGNKSILFKFANEVSVPLYGDEIVLKRGSQVLPLMYFPSGSRPTYGVESPSTKQLWHCHVQLQKKMDDCFHCGIPSIVQRVIPPSRKTKKAWRAGLLAARTTHAGKA